MQTLEIEFGEEHSGTHHVGWASTKGNSAKENMDLARFANREDGAILLIVADGMGGPIGGRQASLLAARCMEMIFHQATAPLWDDVLVKGFLVAQTAILEAATDNPSLGSMGTTMVAVIIDGRRGYVASVGDSRCTLIRNRRVARLTSDHLAIVDGFSDENIGYVKVPENQAKGHPLSNILSKSLGGGEPLTLGEIDLGTFDLANADVLLLYSDGISEYVDEREFANELSRAYEPLVVAKAIVSKAVSDRLSHDHCTMLVARLNGIAEPRQ